MARTSILNAHGEPYPISEVEDLGEILSPEAFWDKLPGLQVQPPKQSLWTVPLFRSFFFGMTEMEEKLVTFQVADATLERDADIPTVSEAMGNKVQSMFVIDDSLPYNPIMTGLDRRMLTYSDRYYPRRNHDYVLQDYLPSYMLTGDERFWRRAEELMAFLRFSRWKEDGSNDFVERYYPEEKLPRPEWAGGWDYVFDWAWLDGYGYQWSLHEPDHHVCAAIASLHVHMFERTGAVHYWEDARSFVMNQIPRYGFHKGVWNGHVYYWTEYNPTGLSEGNPIMDACDNVVALVAMAVSKVAYYETDPVVKGQLLEYTRGLLWYMIREWETDGKWFYDGAENPMNLRKYESHDIVCIVCSLIALVYFYKAGGDIAPFTESLSDMEVRYTTMSGLFQRKAFLKLVKLYDGEPAPGQELKFTSYAHVTGHPLRDVLFRDKLSDGLSVPERFPLRVSRLLPPDAQSSEWRPDPEQDRALWVDRTQLLEGVQLPFELVPKEAARNHSGQPPNPPSLPTSPRTHYLFYLCTSHSVLRSTFYVLRSTLYVLRTTRSTCPTH
ncbi:hypothetical protein [Paenibacillus koleovorans]|uniref:hypothetical protein n=1 Tax=Paenibacillus koleovorans TaxID=121608 RepID=UPI000FDA82E0|nr:hypothetical protein [Paenibacillus koleovorans]